MDITPDEMGLINKYLDSRDDTIIQHIVEHPWAYSVKMVQVAIAFQWASMAPRRIVCWNSILLPEK